MINDPKAIRVSTLSEMNGEETKENIKGKMMLSPQYTSKRTQSVSKGNSKLIRKQSDPFSTMR